MTTRLGTALLIGLALVGAGCKPPEPADWSKYGVSADPARSDATRVVKADAGIQFDVPKAWYEEDGSSEAREEFKRRVNAIVGKVPDWLRIINDNDSGFYSAFLDDEATLRAGVVAEIAGSVKQLPFDFNFKAVKNGRDFRPTSQGAKPLSMTEIELPIGRALHVVDAETVVAASGEGWVKMSNHSFFFGRGDILWLMVFKLPDGDKKAENEMMAIMRSVRISKPNLEAMSKAFQARSAERKRASDEQNKADHEAENRRHEALAEQYRQELEAERLRKQNEPPANPTGSGTPDPAQPPTQQAEPPTDPGTGTPPPDAAGNG